MEHIYQIYKDLVVEMVNNEYTSKSMEMFQAGRKWRLLLVWMI